MFSEIDPILVAEAIIIALIILMQLVVFVRNNATIGKLKKIYPSGSLLETKSEDLVPGSGPEGQKLALLGDNRGFSATFKEISRTINAYLKRNKGQADGEVLEDISTAKDSSIEHSIDANIALPLYIGLLCTFTGVIIGLVKISIEGVSDAAIQSFVGGVLIGMLGSATGLLLTVRSNYLFKEAKKTRDNGRFDFFTFMRANLHSILKESAEGTPGGLRADLAAFQEGFASYQGHMQDSLKETLSLLENIREVSRSVKNLEHGLEGVGQVLEQNENQMENQAAFIDSYAKRAETFTELLSDHFTTIDGKLTRLVDESVNALDQNMNTAYLKMDRYLSSLEGEGSQEFVDGMRQDMAQLQKDSHQLRLRAVEVNGKMLERLEGDEQVNRHISKQMEVMNGSLKQVLLEQQAAKDHFTNSFGFKLFAISGAIAFILAIGGGVAFTVMQLLSI